MTLLLDNLWICAVGFAGFVVLWPVSLWRRDASIVDFWWGPGIGVMAMAVWGVLGWPVDLATLLILAPLLLWSLRLGVHLGIRRVREGSEDPRYFELRKNFSPGWWWKSLFFVFVLQGVLQVMVGLGGLAGLALAPAHSVTSATMALSSVAVLAVLVQTQSDLQLDIYRRRVAHGGLLTTGLRAYVRYPSYSAEIVFWSCIAALAALYGAVWAPASALLIYALLRYVSGVAILEDRLGRTREGFVAYRNTVPALMPRVSGLADTRQKTADYRVST